MVSKATIRTIPKTTTKKVSKLNPQNESIQDRKKQKKTKKVSFTLPIYVIEEVNNMIKDTKTRATYFRDLVKKDLLAKGLINE